MGRPGFGPMTRMKPSDYSVPGHVLRRLDKLGPVYWRPYLNELIAGYEYSAGKLNAADVDGASDWLAYHVSRFEGICERLRWTQRNDKIHPELKGKHATRR